MDVKGGEVGESENQPGEEPIVEGRAKPDDVEADDPEDEPVDVEEVEPDDVEEDDPEDDPVDVEEDEPDDVEEDDPADDLEQGEVGCTLSLVVQLVTELISAVFLLESELVTSQIGVRELY